MPLDPHIKAITDIPGCLGLRIYGELVFGWIEPSSGEATVHIAASFDRQLTCEEQRIIGNAMRAIRGCGTGTPPA